MRPFEPKDEQARWRVLYDYLAGQRLLPGTRFTYAKLADQLGLTDPRDRSVVQQSVQRAFEELEHTHSRTFKNVPGVGYEVAHSRDVPGMVDRDMGTARRKLKRGRRRSQAIIPSELTAEELARAQVTAMQVTNYYRLVGGRQERKRELDTALRLTGASSAELAPPRVSLSQKS